MSDEKEYTLGQSEIGGSDLLVTETPYSAIGGLVLVLIGLIMLGSLLYDILKKK